MAESVKRQPAKRGDARRERWREHRSVRRAEFVEATIRALQRHGPDVGMDEIAAEAGVTKPVIYRHFSDKADLYLAVGQRATQMLLERVVPPIEQTGSPHERIRRVIDAYIGTIEDHPELYRFVVRRSFLDRPVDHDPVAANEEMIATALSRLLGRYMRLLDLDSGAAEPYAFAVVGAVEKAADWWLERQTMSRENLCDYLTTIVWHAIDGLLRSNGIEVDPNAPLDFDGLEPPIQLRVVSEDEPGTATTG